MRLPVKKRLVILACVYAVLALLSIPLLIFVPPYQARVDLTQPVGDPLLERNLKVLALCAVVDTAIILLVPKEWL
jgi:hypothetical protein